MNESMQQAIPDVLAYLFVLQQESVRPREARVRLQSLRGCHRDLEIDLLAEEQTFDQTVHYDVLVRRAGEGTVSLSYCPERVLPWPLRGVHRWNEGDLLRLNGNVLPVDAAMACLDFIWDEVTIIDRLVNMGLIQEELLANPIELTDNELQEAMDKFRAAKKLFRTEDTLRWLERHGMSQEKLERYVAESAIVPKLRDKVTAERVEEYFRDHPGDFDSARIARIELTAKDQAEKLSEQIRSGEQNFYDVAERCFCEATERGESAAGIYHIIERRNAPTAYRAAIFADASGELIGPITVDDGFVLMRVLEIVPAQLDNRVRTAIQKILFDEWLEERRQAAQIEWCWGNASKTG